MAVELLPVEIVADLTEATSQDWDVIAVPVAPGTPDCDEGAQPRAGVLDAAALYGIDLADIADVAGATGKPGETVVIPVPHLLGADTPWHSRPRRIVLLGVGDGGTTAMRTAGASLARACASWGRVLTTAPAAAVEHAGSAAFVEGALLAHHVAFSAKATQPARLTRLGLAPAGGVGVADLSAAVERAIVTATGTALARTLTATPAATATPVWLAEQAVAHAADVPGVTVTVHDEAWITAQGMGGIRAVGAGAVNPPRFVVVDYVPELPDGGAPVGTVAIVGKGISYDTGGLALKPREAMVTMKTDMAGSAVALGAVLVAARLRLPHRVVGVMALAENAFSGSAYRPGDVVTAYDGTTIEIGNTDAEGRMVLADGLGWACSEVAPDVLVDVATLTGAAKLALGTGTGALYASRDELVGPLLAAAEATGEPLWHLPLVTDYVAALDSDVADVSHIATDEHVKAGSITAALFLQRFTGGLPWVHLDIAGPARSAKARAELPEGATGFGVRLLAAWLESLSA